MTSAVIVIPVASTPDTLIIPWALRVLSPRLTTLFLSLTLLQTRKTRTSSTNMSIFLMVRMKVKLVTKNRARSSGPSRGLGSRRSSVKLVHGCPVEEGSDLCEESGGRSPDRASS